MLKFNVLVFLMFFQPSEESVCHAAWLFAYHLGDTAKSVIPLDSLLPYLTNDKDTVKW